jgi:hypothetical protein
MNAFSRSWELTKSTLSVMRQDKEIFAFPILAILTSIVFFVIFGLFAFFAGAFTLISGFSIAILGYVLLFIMYLFLAFIITFFAVCVVYTASIRFNGKDATMGQSISFATRRIGKIMLWAITSATVGIIIKLIENAAQRAKGMGKIILSIFNSILGLAWNISTIFILQGIVYKNLGPFSAIKDSVTTLKKTWGENLIRYFGFGIIESTIIFIGLLILAPIAILTFLGGSVIGLLVVISLIIVYIFSITIFFNLAEGVFNTALYIYANTGKFPQGFTEEQLKSTFKTKPKDALNILE